MAARYCDWQSPPLLQSRRRSPDYLSQSECATLSLGSLVRHRPVRPKAGKTRLPALGQARLVSLPRSRKHYYFLIHSSVLSAPSMFAEASSHFCCSFLYSNVLSVDIDSHLLLCYRVRYQSHIRLNMDSPLPFIAYLVSSDSRCIVSISHLIPPSLCRMIDPLLSVCISYFHTLCIAFLVYTFVVLYLVPQSTSHI